tara:strand:- start:139 stop:687 length:549 start_codon:yes stop_codon:yes gene_type:complete
MYESSNKYWSLRFDGSNFNNGSFYNASGEDETKSILSSGTSFSQDQFNHIGFTINSNGGTTLSVNGVQYADNNTMESGLQRAVLNVLGYLVVGLKQPNGTDQQFIGEIDEVLIIKDTILSSQQFSDIYNDGYGLVNTASYLNNSSNIVGYWRFNEGSGTTTDDASSNDFTTTLEGGTTWLVE